jgi:hypothetical protein
MVKMILALCGREEYIPICSECKHHFLSDGLHDDRRFCTAQGHRLVGYVYGSIECYGLFEREEED